MAAPLGTPELCAGEKLLTADGVLQSFSPHVHRVLACVSKGMNRATALIRSQLGTEHSALEVEEWFGLLDVHAGAPEGLPASPAPGVMLYASVVSRQPLRPVPLDDFKAAFLA